MAAKVIIPSRVENDRINRGISLDADNPEWTDANFARAKPAREVLPSRVYHAAVKRYRGQRGPQKTPVKIPVTLRLDADVLASYKATGVGWQTRINEALRRALTEDEFWTGKDTLAQNKPISVNEHGKETYPQGQQKAKPGKEPGRSEATKKHKKT
ncbi:MAG: BrnA antitoxin family protein [Chthoniobacterales bacterium]